MDFLLNNNFELNIVNGDFNIGNTDLQNVNLIIRLQPGQLRSDPTLGVGIENQLLGVIDSKTRTLINRELDKDGYKIKKFEVIDDELNIEI